MRQVSSVAALFMAMSLVAGETNAQTVAVDPSARLREVLPADVAERVLTRISDARARHLPAGALENRALKFAAKGVAPRDIERSVNEHADRMGATRSAIARARRGDPGGDEIEAGAEAMRKGVDGAAVSRLARSAPQGRSLAIPLFVIGSLADRGLPSDEALQRVLDRLEAKASDAELERMLGELPPRAGGNVERREGVRPDKPRASGRPTAPGRPAGIPGNGGTRKPKPANPRQDG